MKINSKAKTLRAFFATRCLLPTRLLITELLLLSTLLRSPAQRGVLTAGPVGQITDQSGEVVPGATVVVPEPRNRG
jgi:hypothetical protein